MNTSNLIIKSSIFLLLVCLSDAALPCQGCHIDKDEIEAIYRKYTAQDHEFDFQCSACHHYLVNNKEIPGLPSYITKPIRKGLKQKKTYLNARKLTFTVNTTSGKTIKKYNKNGLRLFLQAPVARYPFFSNNSMYQLKNKEIDKLLEKQIHNLSKWDEFNVSLKNTIVMEDMAMINSGEEIFNKHCSLCHNQSGPGPLLRIGTPLLSFSYINAALENDLESVSNKMPNFASLSSKDRISLYLYISQAKSDLDTYKESSTPYKFDLPKNIYPNVIVPLFSHACRHCHAKSAEEQKPFEQFFGSNPIRFFLKRTKLGFEPQDESLPLIFPTGKTCEQSNLLARLKVRAREWRGEYTLNHTGMPLTLKPVDSNTISKIELWQKAGCPIDGKLMCKQCL